MVNNGRTGLGNRRAKTLAYLDKATTDLWRYVATSRRQVLHPGPDLPPRRWPPDPMPFRSLAIWLIDKGVLRGPEGGYFEDFEWHWRFWV